jgi:nicotinamidase-related amidase
MIKIVIAYINYLSLILLISISAFANPIGERVELKTEENGAKISGIVKNYVGKGSEKTLEIQLDNGEIIKASMGNVSFPNSALVIIDMQSGFVESFDDALVANVVADIRKAKSRGKKIIVVEFGSTPTVPKIIDAIGEYSNTVTIHKTENDGSTNIKAYVDKSEVAITKMSICGKHTDACVKETVNGLSRVMDEIKNISVLADSCSHSNFLRAPSEEDHIRALKTMALSQKVKIKRHEFNDGFLSRPEFYELRNHLNGYSNFSFQTGILSSDVKIGYNKLFALFDELNLSGSVKEKIDMLFENDNPLIRKKLIHGLGLISPRSLDINKRLFAALEDRDVEVRALAYYRLTSMTYVLDAKDFPIDYKARLNEAESKLPSEFAAWYGKGRLQLNAEYSNEGDEF